MTQTNVGIVGYSEGNGHPYSFGAIINGYNPDEMHRSRYPGIAQYLSLRKEEEFGIDDWKVTHIWCPDHDIAQHIADCTNIETTVDDYRKMTSEVDVVLILRDDANSHKELASHFLEEDNTVFVDKPLCDTLKDLRYFKPWLENGKLMSCSGFRYYPSIVDQCEGALETNNIVFSHSISIIDWYRYGIHVLEGMTPVMGSEVRWVQNIGEKENDIVRIQYNNGRYALIQVNTEVGFILQSSFYTTEEEHFTIQYDDNFSCFKGVLQALYRQYKTGIPAISPNETEVIIKTLIAGEVSLKLDGQKIALHNLEKHYASTSG